MNTIGLISEGLLLNVVALTPNNVKQLSSHYKVLVECDAGKNAGFLNAEYEEAGATIVENKQHIIDEATVLISYSATISSINSDSYKVIVGCYHVLDNAQAMTPFIRKKIDLFSLDLLPRTTLAQSMDILTSTASVSGYQAVLEAFYNINKVIPMITGAGGTLYPAKVFVIGTGVAGLQAIATAKRMGAVVTAFDVRKRTKNEVESLGATFIEIEGALDDENSGGYAVEQTKDFNTKVLETIGNQLPNVDIVITTAKIPGKEAPKLITQSMVKSMKAGSVIIDLAAENGGNCESTKNNETTIVNGVRIIGDSKLFNKLPASSSILIGNNITSFINYYRTNEELKNEDEILSSTIVIEDGALIHTSVTPQII